MQGALAARLGEFIQSLTGAFMGGVAVDPIHQFEIVSLWALEIPFGDKVIDISFTNSALFMLLTAGAILLFLTMSMGKRSLVPGRMQSLAEISYEFVANMIRDTSGREGLRYFPFIYSLFMFILVANMFGMLPFTFTVTSSVIVTFALALAVILTVIIIGVTRHGFGFLKLFVPSGVPIFLLPLVTLIEVFSFLTRPVSLGIRLFANMLAGHIMLKVFASFIIGLGSLGGVLTITAIGPLAVTVAITALEVLVAFLQAYVFAILASIYLNDALHPGH